MVLRASAPRAKALARRLSSSRAVAISRQTKPALPALGQVPSSSPLRTCGPQTSHRRLTTSALASQQTASASGASSSAPQSATAGDASFIEHTDVAIVGGGVAGLALAASLASSHQGSSNSSSPLRIVLLEASDLDRLRGWAAKHEEQRAAAAGSQGGLHDGIQWENRVVSLTMENWEWLASLGITNYIVQERIKPITAMHVTDGLSGAVLDLGNSIVGSSSSSSSSSQLSNMVELSNLQQALLRYIDAREEDGAVQVDIWDKTKVENVAPDVEDNTHSQGYVDAWPLLSLASSQSQQASTSSAPSSSPSAPTRRQLRPRLLVGADGPSSPVRSYAGIAKTGWPYNRRGLVATLRFDPSQSQQKGSTVAYQRFLPSGTIAWLPLSESSASMVWTLPPDVALALTEMHKAAGNASEAGQAAQRSILADMVTAAWRLPWSSLSRLFNLITSSSARGTPLDAQTIRSELSAHLSEALQSGRAVPEDECPPAVDVDVDTRSVASFPLQVAHTEAYLGSSLLAKQAKNAPVVLPDVAGVVRDVGSWVTRLAASVGQSSSPSAAAAPPPQATTTPRARTVLIGDAAHSVHPLAGQGLNLGVADVRSLGTTLTSALSVGEDVGSHEALRPYEEERWWRNAAMLFAVDRLHAIYSAPVPKRLQGGGAGEEGKAGAALLDAFYEAKVWARSTGVEVLNELDVVKGVMQRFAGSSGGAAGGGQQGTGVRDSTTKTGSQPWPSKMRSGSTSESSRASAP